MTSRESREKKETESVDEAPAREQSGKKRQECEVYTNHPVPSPSLQHPSAGLLHSVLCLLHHETFLLHSLQCPVPPDIHHCKYTGLHFCNILAQCNKTKCWSEKGYEVSHDQYLKGKLFLTITAVDYSNRALYTCVCDGVDACDVRLIIETLASSLQLNPGEALVMDLPIPEPVEVMYKARDSADLYGAQICTVTQRSIHCQPEYTHRASLSYPNITLRDVNMTDSGIYSIRDRKNEEVIHIYTLTVNVVKLETEKEPGSLWWIGVIVVLLLITFIIVVIVVMNHLVQRLKKEKAELEETIKLNGSVTELRSRQRSFSDAGPLLRKMLEMEKLIQLYKPESKRKSLSLPNLNNITVVEMLLKKKEEMEAVVQHRQDLEQYTISQWWSLRRPELDKLIEHWINNENTVLPQHNHQSVTQ
ncbi:hypothetical protein Q7C36_010801 [Tachysurus vachellii]|uniref:Uncharacterized protein n=1 Tax=Tachysurus vachellii TaxID=175792 RepID=A0AA88MVL9_TACVA|nr:hypothetical protein Q7C36_010801 [Tachysurus vachellii]